MKLFADGEIKKMISEYSLEYSHYLEDTYSPSYMSEGGDDATRDLLGTLDLREKRVLEIGSGLGGSAIFVAREFDAEVVGLEINADLVAEATQRTPDSLKDRVSYQLYSQQIPFSDAFFDVIFSKGVLVHVSNKLPLFQEFFRVLEPGGHLAVNDWLSENQGQFGARIERMCELDDLTLFAHTLIHYKTVLKDSGFVSVQAEDKTDQYARYNLDIVERLGTPEVAKSFVEKHSKEELQEAIEGYRLIYEAMKDRELLAMYIRAMKPMHAASS